jgi:hypothetical protein
MNPVSIKITFDDKLDARGYAQYQAMIADRIKEAGIPLGPMLDLARANEMSPKGLEQVWLKEFARHNIQHVYVNDNPDGSTEIIIFPNGSSCLSSPTNPREEDARRIAFHEREIADYEKKLGEAVAACEHWIQVARDHGADIIPNVRDHRCLPVAGQMQQGGQPNEG